MPQVTELSTWEFAKQRAAYEWSMVKLNRYPLLLAVLVQYLHSVATNYVYFLSDVYSVNPATTELVDLGHLLFNFDESYNWTSELITFAIIGFTIVWGATTLIDRNNKNSITVVATRIFLVASLSFVGRVSSFLVTLLPSPSEHCYPSSPDYNPPTTALAILFRMDLFKGCSDLIFSSHTTYVISCILAYNRYGGHRWIKLVERALLVVLVILIVGFERHYSVDVVLAVYIVPFVWYFMSHEYVDKFQAFVLADSSVPEQTAPSDDHFDVEMSPPSGFIDKVKEGMRSRSPTRQDRAASVHLLSPQVEEEMSLE